MGGSLRRRDLSTEEWRPSDVITESDLHEVKVRFGGERRANARNDDEVKSCTTRSKGHTSVMDTYLFCMITPKRIENRDTYLQGIIFNLKTRICRLTVISHSLDKAVELALMIRMPSYKLPTI
jgi:hypothetical protein